MSPTNKPHPPTLSVVTSDSARSALCTAAASCCRSSAPSAASASRCCCSSRSLAASRRSRAACKQSSPGNTALAGSLTLHCKAQPTQLHQGKASVGLQSGHSSCQQRRRRQLAFFCARWRRTQAWMATAAAMRCASSAARAACFLPISVSLQAGRAGRQASAP